MHDNTVVYSDEWRAYRQIQPKLGLQHETINHSVKFVDPSTGVHTQTIESYWAKTKYKFKVMKGVRSDALPSYLDERMWRDRWGTTTKDAKILPNRLISSVIIPYTVPDFPIGSIG